MHSTRELLDSAGYEYIEVLRMPPEKPDEANVTFNNIHPGFGRTRLAGRKLYRHQLEALKALRDGMNLILVSGTGSGKTEAWFSWVASEAHGGRRVRVVAVYPTLALAWDQLARLREYSAAMGVSVHPLDSIARKESGVWKGVRDAWITVTNPAMLLQEVKRHLEKPGSTILSPVLETLDLLVVDEFDYYGPREVALLLGIMELVSVLRKGNLRVAVLSATLANPEELAAYLKRVTGRNAVVIKGRPFRVESRVIVVLGRDIERVRERLRAEAARRGLKLPEEIRDALENPESFREKLYLVVDYFASQGVEESVGIDLAGILSWFALGQAAPQGATLAFTRSINEAERLARELRERLGGRAASIGVHHHLVPKEERRRIEEGARQGTVKLILTPRTLTQGIDIGSIVRVVHIGLPVDVKEFWQREGRKGRREEVAYSESIIIPLGRWDRELLRAGAGALRKWLSLPLERVEINPANHYMALLTGAAKLLSPLLSAVGAGLSELEREALRAARVLGDGVDQGALNRLWKNLNFYEYGPPYGVKRVLEAGGQTLELEEIGRCDLVEKFQPGCLDPSHDSVVVELLTPKKDSRYVKRVVERVLREVLAERSPHWIMDAAEEYRRVKESEWAEKARLLSDFARGFISSEAITIVYPPRRGFGLLKKRPHRCLWTVQSAKLKASVSKDGKVRVYRPIHIVEVPGHVAGEYRDFTYGVLVEGPEGMDPGLLRLGLAALSVYLRRTRGIPLGLFKYSVYTLGPTRLIEVHEESSAGLLDRLDWAQVAAEIRSWSPDNIDEILLLALDDVSYSILEGLGFDWGRAIEAAATAAGSLASRQALEVVMAGVKVTVEKPSRSLKRGAVAVIAHNVKVEGVAVDFILAGVAYYDGENVRSAVDLVMAGSRVRPRGELAAIEHDILDDVEYEGFTLYTVDPGAAASEAGKAGLRRLSRLLQSSIGLEGLAGNAGLPASSPEDILDYVEAPGLPRVESDVIHLVERLGRPLGLSRGGRLPKRIEDKVREYLESRAIGVYISSLVLEKLAGSPPKSLGGSGG